MTFKPAFPPAALNYIKRHINEWPSVLAWEISHPKMFGYPCTDRGVRELVKKIRRDLGESEKAKTL